MPDKLRSRKKNFFNISYGKTLKASCLDIPWYCGDVCKIGSENVSLINRKRCNYSFYGIFEIFTRSDNQIRPHFL